MIVLDASTLILLAKVGLLDLFLESLSKKPVISSTVLQEVTRKGSFDSLLIGERIKENKILSVQVKDNEFVEKIAKDFKLHLGEAETLALCLENNYDLVATDDYSAMKACVVLQIKYISAIGFLLKINKEKKLNKKEALLKLRQLSYFGRYSDEIIDEIKNNLR
ncbi:MAG: hypothetical protein HYW50_03015 [Candidatus Diapherotrites archaeon]|nr:hypothetical protein [Candidatus Diapherotrites archaeon]